jgi:hypothetical protein
VRTQTAQIVSCYASGRRRARALIADLEFMNLPFFTRTLAIIIGPSPVSARHTLVLRLVFSLLVLVLSWAVWVTVDDLVQTSDLGDLVRGWRTSPL